MWGKIIFRKSWKMSCEKFACENKYFGKKCMWKINPEKKNVNIILEKKWILEKNHVEKIHYFVIGPEKMKSWKIHFEEKKITWK